MKLRFPISAFLICLLTASAAAAAPPVGNGNLLLDVAGVRNSAGKVIATLCREGETFPSRCTRSARGLANAGVVTLTFPNLPPGRYAVALFHDENANGKLEFYREGIAFSNNANLAMAPPNFKASSFVVNGETGIRVRIKYFHK